MFQAVATIEQWNCQDEDRKATFREPRSTFSCNSFPTISPLLLTKNRTSGQDVIQFGQQRTRDPDDKQELADLEASYKEEVDSVQEYNKLEKKKRGRHKAKNVLKAYPCTSDRLDKLQVCGADEATYDKDADEEDEDMDSVNPFETENSKYGDRDEEPTWAQLLHCKFGLTAAYLDERRRHTESISHCALKTLCAQMKCKGLLILGEIMEGEEEEVFLSILTFSRVHSGSLEKHPSIDFEKLLQTPSSPPGRTGKVLSAASSMQALQAPVCPHSV
ncbi:hypothetical protein DFH08DRAFT_803494 [Mycena albidolilacea]|uniref:Uncharacterized protein n=1 Tax=Mycena albidolilacea TaxID=1033008 RepID=A0AAD7EXH8_9AGAR|nr:hypothetical protein DFH08DRAFT_803494 [Mycena albidolilacea]